MTPTSKAVSILVIKFTPRGLGPTEPKALADETAVARPPARLDGISRPTASDHPASDHAVDSLRRGHPDNAADTAPADPMCGRPGMTSRNDARIVARIVVRRDESSVVDLLRASSRWSIEPGSGEVCSGIAEESVA